MELEKITDESKPHTVRRKTKSGVVSEYSYKLFRVMGRAGAPTTISMPHLEHMELRSKYKLTQGGLSRTVRAAAGHLIAKGKLREELKFSHQVLALTVQLLEANRLGVTLADFEHANANNAAWGE